MFASSGKLVQDRLAEGVDGLDLQPARRLQRLGEQPARPLQLVGAGRRAFEPVDLSADSAVVGKRGPAGEVVIDALGHVGGGGLAYRSGTGSWTARRRRAAAG